MADNVTLNSGSGGATCASDDIGGVQYQRVKLIHGADGTNDGDVSSANGLPIRYECDTAVLETNTTPLAGTATYTSNTIDTVHDGSYVTHYILADQSGTHYFEESHNGTTWNVSDSDAVTANVPFFEHHICVARYHRTRFVNGVTPQTSFIHQVIPRHIGSPAYIHLAAEGNTVSQALADTWKVKGDYIHNNSAEVGTSALFALPAIATAAKPSYGTGNLIALSTTLEGNLRCVIDADGTPAGITRVAQSATNVTGISGNASRSYAIIHNNSTANLYIKFGATVNLGAGTESYSYKIRPDETWEMISDFHYEGSIDFMWDAAGGGFAMVTDMSAA